MVVFKNCVIFSHGTAFETEVAGAVNGIYVSGHPVGPTPTSAQVTIGFNRLRNC